MNLSIPTALAAALGPILFKPKRSIGGIVANATIEEVHDDDLTITAHPVQQGAVITDHAFKNPAKLQIRCAWSNSTLQAAIAGDISIGSLGSSYVKDIYNQLLALQVSRQLIQVYTGKRVYQDMLIAGLHMTTDDATENALFCDVRLQQIILASVTTVTVPAADVQQTPEKNAPIINKGQKAIMTAPTYNPGW